MAALADVAYVDMLEGDTECHVRFKTPADAQVIMKSYKEIQIKNNWKFEVLTGKTFSFFFFFPQWYYRRQLKYGKKYSVVVLWIY